MLFQVLKALIVMTYQHQNSSLLGYCSTICWWIGTFSLFIKGIPPLPKCQFLLDLWGPIYGSDCQLFSLRNLELASLFSFYKVDRCLARYSPRAEANNALPCNTEDIIQYHAIPCDTTWKLCDTMRYKAIPCMQYHTMPCNTMESITIRFLGFFRMMYVCIWCWSLIWIPSLFCNLV